MNEEKLNEEILSQYLASYKNDFSNHWEKEGFKWQAVQHFQNTWDIEAEDFAGMFKDAVSKLSHILDSGKETPGNGIIKFANKDKEKVREFFKELFDEKIDLKQRLDKFYSESKAFYEQNFKQEEEGTQFGKSRQTLKAISVYLAFKYPNKYYIYKEQVFKNLFEKLGLEINSKSGKTERIMECFKVYDQICLFLKNDKKLDALLRSRLAQGDYQDNELKHLTGDFIWYIAQQEKAKPAEEKGYWWLVASPKYWSLDDIEVGECQAYTIKNEKGNKRRIAKNFENAKENDLVIGYEATPAKQIKAIFKVKKASDGEYIVFEKVEDAVNRLGFYELKENLVLRNMEFLKNTNGSLFKLTKEEYDCLEKLVKVKPKTEKYTREAFLKEVYLDKKQFDELYALLKYKKNVILQGAPGVGKTFAAKRLAYAMMGKKDDKRIQLVQFHQNYSYEDFIKGYKPDKNGFEMTPGVFYNFCQKASEDLEHEYFFIIDEINRGNLSKIFGELLMLIEKDYRGQTLSLAYGAEEFTIPPNLYLIGMMNTADRSLAMLDYALRRRFCFFEMKPAFASNGFKKYQEELQNEKFNNLVIKVQELNEEIRKDSSLGRGFCIGHSYFCKQEDGVDVEDWLANIVKYELIPMLEEYWFDDEPKFEEWKAKLLGCIEK